MSNNTAARLLRGAAKLLEVQGANEFRVSAYRRAAEAIQNPTLDLGNLSDEDE